MRRKPIFILCIFNTLIALAALGTYLPKLLAQPAQQKHDAPSTRADALTDSERWAHALASTNERQTAYHLSQIQSPAFKQAQIHAELQKLQDDPQKDSTSLNALRRNTTLITEYGQLAQAPNDLNLLIFNFKKQTLPITLREAALRSHIEASVRLYKAEDGKQNPEIRRRETINRCCNLIDQAYTEKQTSLVGLALQADCFLEQNELLSEARRITFQQNLIETLTTPSALNSNRLVCINILNASGNHDLASTETLFELYEASDSDALKEAILTSLTAKNDPVTGAWLRQQTASSPKLEQLQLAAIEAVQSDTARQP